MPNNQSPANMPPMPDPDSIISMPETKLVSNAMTRAVQELLSKEVSYDDAEEPMVPEESMAGLPPHRLLASQEVKASFMTGMLYLIQLESGEKLVIQALDVNEPNLKFSKACGEEIVAACLATAKNLPSDVQLVPIFNFMDSWFPPFNDANNVAIYIGLLNSQFGTGFPVCVIPESTDNQMESYRNHLAITSVQGFASNLSMALQMFFHDSKSLQNAQLGFIQRGIGCVSDARSVKEVIAKIDPALLGTLDKFPITLPSAKPGLSIGDILPQAFAVAYLKSLPPEDLEQFQSPEEL